jgi:hypothetical protein
MEIPPCQSIAEVSNIFNDFSHEKQRQELLSFTPNSYLNKFEDSSDRNVALSNTSERSDFRIDDFIQGSDILNGKLKYPFQSVADIWTSKTDPFYFDGSEDNNVFHLQENLIGKPLGSDLLQDPNLTFVENLLKLKENQFEENIIDDDYIKNLYTFNVEKGVNYYLNQVQNEHEKLASFVRDEKIRKNIERPALLTNYQAYPHGDFEHPNKFQVGTVYFPSANPFQQSNARQNKFDRISKKYPNLYVNSSNPSYLPELDGLKIDSNRQTLKSKRRLEFQDTF